MKYCFIRSEALAVECVIGKILLSKSKQWLLISQKENIMLWAEALNMFFQTSWYYCLVFNLVKIVITYSVGYRLKSKEASKEVSEVHLEIFYHNNQPKMKLIMKNIPWGWKNPNGQFKAVNVRSFFDLWGHVQCRSFLEGLKMELVWIKTNKRYNLLF